MARYDCGTHTAFFGRVEDVIIPSEAEDEISPLDWLNGAQASIAIERPV
jgi:flavin reductase (DIM6/NTAB) family NADH-FMN oxidoreductase RutF